MSSHFTGAIVFQEGPDGMEFLVIEYDSGNGTQIKFPGGTNNDHLKEKPLGTLSRETEEETGLVPIEASLVERIYIPGSKDKPPHTKLFYAIPFQTCWGELRTLPKKDDGDYLSPPFWRTAKELEGKIFHTHVPALRAIVSKLGR